jgi:hypothetical protein
MPLVAGQYLGPYEIQSLIGAGGLGRSIGRVIPVSAVTLLSRFYRPI